MVYNINHPGITKRSLKGIISMRIVKLMAVSFGALVEDNGLVTVQNDTPLCHVLDSSSEHVALHVATGMGQLFGAHSVVDPNDVLLNDGALIQVTGDEMGGGTDDFHTTIVGLVVGLGTLERRQEAVVDVDDAAGHGRAQGRRQNLHVPSQHNQINVILANQFQNLGLLLRLGIRGDRKVVEWNVIGGREGGKIGVVGNDQGDLDAKLTGRLTEEQIIEAVTDLGDHDQHAGLFHSGVDFEVKGERLGRGGKRSSQFLEFGGLITSSGLRKLSAHKETLRGRVTELGRIDDVEVILHEKSSDRMDDTRAVRARKSENEARSHYIQTVLNPLSNTFLKF